LHTWHRRDYLRDVIIEYQPITIEAGDDSMKKFKPVLPLDPHGWGVVPFAWMRPDGTPPGDLDGPALITPQFMSVARAADYSATMRDTAYAYNAFPRIALVDADLNAKGGPPGQTQHDFASGDPGAFMSVKSGRQGNGDVKLLETTGAAIDKGLSHGDQLRKDGANLSGVHDLAEDENAGAMSGTAVQRRQEPTVATVQEYRAVIVDGLNLVWWKLRRVVGGRQDTKVVFTWPAALTQTAEDATMWAQALVGAHSGGLISHETAVKKFAGVIGTEDAEAELERINEEKDEREAKMLEQMTQTVPGQPTPPGGEGDDEGDGGGDA
jgi:hypothetical protein